MSRASSRQRGAANIGRPYKLDDWFVLTASRRASDHSHYENQLKAWASVPTSRSAPALRSTKHSATAASGDIEIDCSGDIAGAILGWMGLLTSSDLRQFANDGYVVVRNVVPESLLAAADAELDGLIAEMAMGDGDAGPGQHAWCSPRSRLPRCDDVLRQSPALAMARELVSPNDIDHAGLDGSRYDHIQVAITVPPWSHIPGGPHIDGWSPGDSFTMLAGVLLTDQHETQSGNLWVWPGSHLEHERLFRERGTRILERSGVDGHTMRLDPPVVLRPARPITGGRGDLVLAHFLTGHNKGGNTRAHVRRTIYYRLNVPGHVHRSEQTLVDAWLEYPRMRAFRRSASS